MCSGQSQFLAFRDVGHGRRTSRRSDGCGDRGDGGEGQGCRQIGVVTEVADQGWASDGAEVAEGADVRGPGC